MTWDPVVASLAWGPGTRMEKSHRILGQKNFQTHIVEEGGWVKFRNSQEIHFISGQDAGFFL